MKTVKFNEFSVCGKEAEVTGDVMDYTNTNDENWKVTYGDEVSKVYARDNVTLKAGQYIGLKLDRIHAIASIDTEGNGTDKLTLQTSLNQKEWTDSTSAKSARYIRLINNGSTDVTFSLSKFEVTNDEIGAMDLFEKLNFKDSARVWKSYPFELSGGMNQRAGIAIAMLMNPPILFADEPTSALDVSVQRQVVKEMLKLRELFGTAIVIVTHDIGVVRAMADTVLVLKDGKTVEYGTADVILDHPKDPYTKKLLAAVPKLQRKVKA